MFKFYTSVEKELKLKLKKFDGPVSTFLDITGDKLVEEAFANRNKPRPHLILNRINKMLILAEEWTVVCHFTTFRDFSDISHFPMP